MLGIKLSHVTKRGYWSSGSDSRNDPLAIGSDSIVWSWSADRIPQTPITIGSSDREDTKPNCILAIESRYKSFIGTFRTDIMRSRLDEKRQTDDMYSWRHNGRCGNVIYVCRYRERHDQFSARTRCCSWYNTVWTCHVWQVYVVNIIEHL